MKQLLLVFGITVSLHCAQQNVTLPAIKGISVNEYYEQHCAECHGVEGKAHALGKSEAIYYWDEKKLEFALSGYKLNTYGRSMKNVMQSQVNLLTFKDLRTLSLYIAEFKVNDKAKH